ncbi:hypothetical protein N489_10440 [Lactococcus lactis subsp. lactis 1AA59]|nr:hypothetical protein N489_10440 [Lactococcus lactis subsp. lactis 1AA59]
MKNSLSIVAFRAAAYRQKEKGATIFGVEVQSQMVLMTGKI